MNTEDIRDFTAFANIKAIAGHAERYVYARNGRLHFGVAPITEQDFRSLVIVGGIEDN